MKIDFRAFFCVLILFGVNAKSQVLIPQNSEWKYFKGTSAPSSDMISWVKSDFDDSSWPTSTMPFRYGDGTGGTDLSDMRYHYSTLFLRKEIDISTPDSLIGGLTLTFSYDDGIRIYINDDVVLEGNAPLNSSYTDTATATISDFSPETVTITENKGGLKSGKNIIAIEGYNVTLGGSSDFYCDVQATLIQRTPELPSAPEVSFSKPGGYYTNTFSLVLSTPLAGDTIKYTIDCSEPGTSKTAIIGKSPVTLTVDPSISTGRPSTPAFVVRAIASKSGCRTSNSETRTYIFLDQVKTQKYPGGNWPSANIGEQIVDYNMDSRVINDSRYVNSIGDAFSSVPTVSLVTENPNLWDPTNGIYVNALNHGVTWERPASLELVDTDNSEAFSMDVGVRIRGGWSRHGDNPKHAFRIFFRDDYGKKSIKYPIFGSDAAQEFDKFDLRCAQNYSWSYYDNSRMTYAQDEFCRDMQGLMGHPYTRSRYCHLFLNGMYWGLYEFQERPEANFGASYIGGKKDHFDVIKIATDLGYTIEATDGTLDKWKKLYDLTNQGFENNSDYYSVQGLNSQGKVDTSLESLVDVDNLVDYMLNIFYSGNFDSPVSQFGGNNNPNNFYCLKNRNHKREGFIFIVHDAEHTLNYVPNSEVSGNDGVNENRVDLINDGMSEPSFEKFHPQWLHYKLSLNAEYRMKFADHAYKFLFNNGLFTSDRATSVFMNRAQQINMAIIGESARWGDSRYGYLNTKDDSWIPAINNTVNDFIDLRTPIVIQQLIDADLLPSCNAVSIKKDGTELSSDVVNLNGAVSVSLNNPNSTGTIYYTLDGSDPRLMGGSLNPNAVEASNGLAVSVSYPLKLKTRVKSGTVWSPLREVLFTNKDNRENIRITEIQYHAAGYGSIGDKDLEFIELKNIGDKGIDLGGLRLDSAVQFTFPSGTIINPKGFVVIASDANGFEFLYKMKPTGKFSGNLANEGERIVLLDEAGKALIDFKYEPTYPWPIKANSIGYSLVAKDKLPDGDPGQATYWRASNKIYGSPFSDDDDYVDPNAVQNLSLGKPEIYPNPASDLLNVRSSMSSIKSIQIFDISGRMIFNRSYSNVTGATLSLPSLHLNEGVYFVKINTLNGLVTDKLIYRKK